MRLQYIEGLVSLTTHCIDTICCQRMHGCNGMPAYCNLIHTWLLQDGEELRKQGWDDLQATLCLHI